MQTFCRVRMSSKHTAQIGACVSSFSELSSSVSDDGVERSGEAFGIGALYVEIAAHITICLNDSPFPQSEGVSAIGSTLWAPPRGGLASRLECTFSRTLGMEFDERRVSGNASGTLAKSSASRPISELELIADTARCNRRRRMIIRKEWRTHMNSMNEAKTTHNIVIAMSSGVRVL